MLRPWRKYSQMAGLLCRASALVRMKKIQLVYMLCRTLFSKEQTHSCSLLFMPVWLDLIFLITIPEVRCCFQFASVNRPVDTTDLGGQGPDCWWNDFHTGITPRNSIKCGAVIVCYQSTTFSIWHVLCVILTIFISRHSPFQTKRFLFRLPWLWDFSFIWGFYEDHLILPIS